jgi:Mrp family chromosome partitioning ATPase
MSGYSEANLIGRGGRGAVATAIANSWQIALIIFACAVVVSVVVAYALPSVYESTATVEMTPEAEGGGAGKPAESEIRGLLSDPARMERLLRDSPARPKDGPSSESLASSAKVVAVSDHQFSVSYFGSTPELARQGCAMLADTIVAYFTKRGARAEVERRTKALADFVNSHPAILTEEAQSQVAQPSGGAKPPVPGVDAALEALKRQRATLEAEIAEQSAADPTHANPYDEGGPSAADLHRQLAEVKYAISTRQRAVAAATNAPSSPSPAAAAAASAAPEQIALQAQYRALVRDVVEAEHLPPKGPASSPARIVRAATVPDDPVKPNRPVIIGVGGLAGLWLSVLAIVLRVQHGTRRRLADEDEEEDAAPATLGTRPLAVAPAAPQLPASRVEATPAAPPPETPKVVDAPRPMGSGGTQIGMMDPALVRTQIGGTPAELMLLAAAKPPEPPAAAEPVAATVEATPEPPRVQAAPAAADQPPQTLRGIQRSGTDAPPSARGTTGEAPRVLIPRPHSSHPPPAQATRSPSDGPPKQVAAKPTMRPPAAPRTIDVFSPPDGKEGAGPDTQRMGTGHGSLATFPRTISPPPPPPSVPPPRGETSGTRYSFVDRSRASRAPASDRPHTPSARPVADRPSRSTGRTGTLVEVQDISSNDASATSERSGVHPPPATVVEEPRATRAMVQETTGRPAEVWEKKSRAPEPDEIVVSQPASQRWRMPSGLMRANGSLNGLRDQILESSARGPFVLAVTSEQGCVEAKTTVAAKLSGLLSHNDRVRVLLVEANFDFPALHRVLSVEMPPGSGFSQQLRSRLRNGRKPWSVVHCATSLDVLAEGPVRSPGVLLSQEFANAIAELRTCYDVIVLDSPVMGQGVETKPINAVSDGIAIIAASQSAVRAVLDRAMNHYGQKKLMVALPVSEAK